MKKANTAYGVFNYFDNDDIGNRIANGEFFDAHYRPVMDTLNEDSVLIDVGANIGFFTLYAALHRKANVLAFEPSHRVYDLLVLNVMENAVSLRVHMYNCALYDSNSKILRINPRWPHPTTPYGNIDYEKCENSGGLSLVEEKQLRLADEEVWFPRTLDSFECGKVTVLKIDTQGSDLRVLVGATATINLTRPIICFEFEHDGSGKNASGDTLDDFMKFFDAMKYEVRYAGGDDNVNWSDYIAEPKEKR